MDISKNADELGKAAGAAALQLCNGAAGRRRSAGVVDPAVAPAAGLSAQRGDTGGTSVSSFVLTPTPLTAENLQLAIDGGQITKEDLSKGVDAAKARPPAVAFPSTVRLAIDPRPPAPPGARVVHLQDQESRRDERGRHGTGFGQAVPARTSIRRLIAQTEIDLRLFGMVVALAVILIVFHIWSGGTFAPTNMVTLAVQATGIAIIATGMVMVIVSRNIDLSVGSLVGFIAMSYALIMTDWLPTPAPEP